MNEEQRTSQRAYMLGHHISLLAAQRRGDRIERDFDPSSPENLIELGVPELLIEPLLERHDVILSGTRMIDDEGRAEQTVMRMVWLDYWNNELTRLADLTQLAEDLRNDLDISRTSG